MTVSPIGGHEAAEHRRVDDDFQVDLLPVALASAAQALLLVVGERHGAADLGDLGVLASRRPLDEAVDDRGQVAAAAACRPHRDELRRWSARLAAEQVFDDRLAAGGRDHSSVRALRSSSLVS